jgi:hypothetical protein
VIPLHFCTAATNRNFQEGFGRPDLESQVMDTNNDLALEGRRTRPAIYCIENVDSGRRLIASTMNLSKRLYDQRRALDRHEHFNAALNADLAAHPPQNFRLVLLEIVEDPRLLAPLKRLHTEVARQSAGGAYNIEPNPARKKLAIDQETSKLVAEKWNQSASDMLTSALERMRSGRIDRQSIVADVLRGLDQRRFSDR